MLKAWTFVSSRLAALKRDERGVSALEYGAIAALILVAIIAALGTIGTSLRETFNLVAGVLPGGGSGGGSSGGGGGG